MQIKMHKSALIRIANISIFLFVMLLFFIFEREELLTNMLSDTDNYSSSLRNISLFVLTLTLSVCALYGRWSGNKLFICYMLLTIVVTTILLTIGIFIALQGGIYAINFMRVLRLVLLENYRGGGPYLFLMFLPFVMLFTKKAIKITFVILIMLCIVSSMKRGAILAGLLSIIVYYFVSTLQSKNSNPIFKIIGISAVVLFVIIFFLAFDAFTGGTIIERFADGKKRT